MKGRSLGWGDDDVLRWTDAKIEMAIRHHALRLRLLMRERERRRRIDKN